MKKIRLFFHGVIFLAVMSGLFSARTASSHASRQGVSHSQVVHQVPAAVASQGPQTPEDLPPASIRFDRITIAEGLSFSKVEGVAKIVDPGNP